MEGLALGLHPIWIQVPAAYFGKRNKEDTIKLNTSYLING
jgi:hypothetical protein